MAVVAQAFRPATSARAALKGCALSVASVALTTAACVALATAAAMTADGPFDLPAPTGPHRVGTTTWRVTDPVRTETLADGGARREVEVLAWYPRQRSPSDSASGGGPPAPYLREGLGEVQGFASLFRAATDVFDRLADVQTHAIVDAEPASAALPVLVFSHGMGSLATAYTALLEDLASHGYAVISI